MWGALAQVMAQGLRAKREAEDRQHARGLELADRYEAGQARQEEGRRYQAQQERQAEDDALARELIRLNIADAQHRNAGTGRHTPRPERDPIADYEAKIGVDRRYGINDFAPRQAPEVNWSTVTGADGQIYQVHPRTGAVRPLEVARGQPLRTGAGAARSVPSSVALRLGALEHLAGMTTTAETALQGAVDQGVNATGAVFGRLSPALRGMGRIDPAAVSAQAALANIASEIMKARSGGAVTPQEFERLEPFLPSRNDDEQVALQKLRDLHAYLQQSRESELESLEAASYDVSRFRQRGGTPPENAGPASRTTPPPPPVGMSPSDYLRQMHAGEGRPLRAPRTGHHPENPYQ